MAAVRSAARRAFNASVGERGRGLAGLVNGQTLQGLLIAGRWQDHILTALTNRLWRPR